MFLVSPGHNFEGSNHLCIWEPVITMSFAAQLIPNNDFDIAPDLDTDPNPHFGS